MNWELLGRAALNVIAIIAMICVGVSVLVGLIALVITHPLIGVPILVAAVFGFFVYCEYTELK